MPVEVGERGLELLLLLLFIHCVKYVYLFISRVLQDDLHLLNLNDAVVRVDRMFLAEEEGLERDERSVEFEEVGVVGCCRSWSTVEMVRVRMHLC